MDFVLFWRYRFEVEINKFYYITLATTKKGCPIHNFGATAMILGILELAAPMLLF